MCGIVGYVGNKNLNIEKSAQLLIHRGPDATSINKSEHFTVAFNRLSIIDISKNAMQPYKYQDIEVYFNGEIYNYLELNNLFRKEFTPKSQSDGEIIAFLYQKFSINFLHYLNGMFSIVIFDKKKRKAFFIRDRFAEKPLFYTFQDNLFYFSSEIKALRPLVNLKENINNIVLNFNCHFLPQGYSLFEGVKGVNPGSYIELDYSKNLIFKEHKWYNPKIKKKTLSKIDFFDSLDLNLNNSLKIRTRSDVPVGIFLSGGLDSSCIAYYAKKNTIKNLTSLTALIEKKEEFENNTDIIFPKKFSEHLGIQNYNFNFDFDFFNQNFLNIASNYEELFLDSGNLIFYGLSSEAKKLGIKVTLHGHGGDEIFGGYSWQKQYKYFPNFLINYFFSNETKLKNLFLNKYLNHNKKVLKFLKILLAPKVWHAESLSDGIFFNFLKEKDKYLDTIFDVTNSIYKNNKTILSNDVGNNINLMNIFYTLGACMYSTDMGSMFNSVENRSPFMDYNIFESLFSVGDSFKNKNGNKSLLREFLKYKNFPNYIINAKKSGPTMNTIYLVNKLNKDNKLQLFLIKNKSILNYVFNKDINLSSINFNNKINSFIIFGFMSLILWFKFHIDEKKDFANLNLTEVMLDI